MVRNSRFGKAQYRGRLLFGSVLVAAFAGQMQAQAPQSSLQGRVLDPARAPIVGARITAVPEVAAAGSAAVSGQMGDFSLLLSPGKYSVRIAADGFQEFAQTLEIELPESDRRDFVLQLSTVRSEVVVSEDSGYLPAAISTATRTLTPLRDVPQSITIVPKELIRDQMMMSIGDVVGYVPGVTAHQGENNRDDVVIRGNRSSAAVFFSLTEQLRLQSNVENLFDRKYYINADSNTNISPGFPRAVRVGLTARF